MKGGLDADERVKRVGICIRVKRMGVVAVLKCHIENPFPLTCEMRSSRTVPMVPLAAFLRLR